MNVIHEKCEKKVADDKKLPKSSYLVTYVEKEKISYDIVIADSRVEIFDHYWDKYHNVISMKQTEGRANPKLWQNPNKKSK